VAITMHCNRRPPDVALVVLGFNYEAYIIAPSAKFQLNRTDNPRPS